jgi:hypothetical protein
VESHAKARDNPRSIIFSLRFSLSGPRKPVFILPYLSCATLFPRAPAPGPLRRPAALAGGSVALNPMQMLADVKPAFAAVALPSSRSAAQRASAGTPDSASVCPRTARWNCSSSSRSWSSCRRRNSTFIRSQAAHIHSESTGSFRARELPGTQPCRGYGGLSLFTCHLRPLVTRHCFLTRIATRP